MVNIIKELFEKYVKPDSGSSESVSEQSLQIATAALLIEMMRADAEISEEEKKTISQTMRLRFKLSDKEVHALMRLAEEEIWRATGYHEFTSLINKGLTHGQKIKVVEHLWEVAYADSILDKHEEYMVRKIAGLIYVSHKEFIDAKLRMKAKMKSC